MTDEFINLSTGPRPGAGSVPSRVRPLGDGGKVSRAYLVELVVGPPPELPTAKRVRPVPKWDLDPIKRGEAEYA